MNKAKRNAVIAGNWKMNKTASEARELIDGLLPLVKDADCTVIIGVPFTDIHVAVEMTKGSNVHVAAQNCHFEASGAFTGEVSAPMLKEEGVEYVILGHSERRQYYGETSDTLVAKMALALENGLSPIYCVGEMLSEREAGNHFNVIKAQLEEVLFGLSAEQMAKVVIAYEPVWAIGTGVTATSEQAQEVHAFIRKTLAAKFGELANDITILYGGSCKPSNAKELFACPDIDGGLIGGASLKADDFIAIAQSY